MTRTPGISKTTVHRQRRELRRQVAIDLIPPKARLVELLADLETMGGNRDAAERLARIIVALEGWQGRFG